VAVRVLADAVVIEQPVPVAEVDLLGNRIHLPSLSRGIVYSAMNSARTSIDRPGGRLAP
jgi:hypothetical protein